MEFQSEKNVISTVKGIFKTVLTAFLITVVLMAVLALAVCYTPLPEEAVTPCVYVLNYLSVFKKSDSKFKNYFSKMQHIVNYYIYKVLF